MYDLTPNQLADATAHARDVFFDAGHRGNNRLRERYPNGCSLAEAIDYFCLIWSPDRPWRIESVQTREAGGLWIRGRNLYTRTAQHPDGEPFNWGITVVCTQSHRFAFAPNCVETAAIHTFSRLFPDFCFVCGETHPDSDERSICESCWRAEHVNDSPQTLSCFI